MDVPVYSLRQFSVFIRPPEGAMAAIFKGWLDDSRNGPYWAVGGYAAAWHRWEFFEREWSQVLTDHGVPYFHMREMASPTGVYAKWHPYHEHTHEVTAFLADLAKVISDSRIVALLSVVRISDLERFNAERGVALEAYPLAAYGCMMMASHDNPGSPTELIFDHVEKIGSKLARAQSYADADHEREAALSQIQMVPLGRKLTFRNVSPLQAADFAVWEFRKQHEKIGAAFDLITEIRDPEFAWKKLMKGIVDEYGSLEAAARKSAVALMMRNEIYPFVWDYRHLNEAHEARRGVWGDLS